MDVTSQMGEEKLLLLSWLLSQVIAVEASCYDRGTFRMPVERPMGGGVQPTAREESHPWE